MSERRPIVGGNWKMNTNLAGAAALAEAVATGVEGVGGGCEVAIFPPFPYVHAARQAIGDGGVLLGAQDVYHEPDGAFTGEVSTAMLTDLGVQIVLAGHSERRHVIGEDDALVNRKLLAALDAGLRVVLCVGETLQEREAGQADAVIVRQLQQGLADVPGSCMERVVIAYEPVWAIGTGRTASPADAQSAHEVLRTTLAKGYDEAVAGSTRIQYGGSVKAGNAADLFAGPDIDGFLVGGASLKADEFLAIVTAAAGGAG